MNTKISVVVPVYNVEKYLKRCVDSVLNQTYQNLEIILVNDGSTDNSGDICDEYARKDKRITVIHQSNQGLSGARNAGIDILTGEYVGFIDSDDYINQRMYEVLLTNIMDKKADISICSYSRFWGDNALVEKKNEQVELYTSQEALKNLHGINGQVFTLAWNKLYRSGLFEKLRYPLKKLNEDEFITYQLIDQSNQIVVTNQVLYYYFQNENSITTNQKYLINQDIFEALEQRKIYFLEKKKEDMIPGIHRAYLDRVIARYGMMLESKKATKQDLKVMHQLYKPYYKNIKRVMKGVGYQLFYFIPKGYFVLLHVKQRVYHQRRQGGANYERKAI